MRFSFRTTTALGTTLAGLIPGVSAVQAAPAGTPFDWSGPYLGGTIGVVRQNATGTATYPNGSQTGTSGFTFNNNTLYFDDDVEAASLPTIFGLGGTGGAVGVDGGYNLTAGSFVYGVEGDIRVLFNAGSSQTQVSHEATVTFDSSLTSLATLRARAGISADRLLLFATAGLATGGSSLSTSFNYADTSGSDSKAAALSGNGFNMPVGYVAGAGAEYAVNDNMTLKGQALYYNLGSTSITATDRGSTDNGVKTTAAPYTASFAQNGVIVETGVNFKF
jgi:outer membrane immunogenic protein